MRLPGQSGSLASHILSAVRIGLNRATEKQEKEHTKNMVLIEEQTKKMEKEHAKTMAMMEKHSRNIGETGRGACKDQQGDVGGVCKDYQGDDGGAGGCCAAATAAKPFAKEVGLGGDPPITDNAPDPVSLLKP